MNKYIARLNASSGPKGYFKKQIYTKRDWLAYEPYIEEVKSMFADKEDRNLYSTIVEGRRAQSRHIKSFNSISVPMLWQYIEFINRAEVNTIIDGGVTDGLQLLGFFLFFKKKITVFGFEPLYQVYLCSDYKPWLDCLNVKVFPIALSKHNGKVKFYEAKDKVSSTTIKNGMYFKNKPKYAPSISIDKFCKSKNIKVDYIKLDIEGAEYEALQGAQQTLRAQRPQIAVSLYHSKEDLFRIPLLLKKTLKNYYYKISHYTSCYIETILYAIPEELRVKSYFCWKNKS